jgi:FAD/FMN-containing dehydrogenase
MSTAADRAIAEIRKSLPDIRAVTPDSEDYGTFTKTFNNTDVRPAAVFRPRTAQHVQALIKTCVAHGAEFHIRSGGHNTVGKSLYNKALTIDMRDINYVHVNEDKTTAVVGGGTNFATLSKALERHGLLTPR